MSEEKKELTSEQVEENRNKVIQYYKKQVEALEHQAKYETLMADIEQARARRMEMIIRQAQMAAGPEDENNNPDNTDTPAEEATQEKKERKLKAK